MTEDYYEYFPDRRDSWCRKDLPTHPIWFDDELKTIAGVNRHGQPNLRLVWGGSVMSDRSERPRLKYHAGWSAKEVQGYRYKDGDEWIFTQNIDELDPSIMVMPDVGQEQLGVPRWIVERWVSPEELENARRFRTQKDAETGQKLLRDFPREGVYDAYFVVQNLQGKFRPVDRDVLAFIKMKWHFEQKSFAEAEAMIDAYDAKEQEQAEKYENELWNAANNFDLRLDPEERERREEYWAKHHDYVAEYKRMMAMS